MDDLINNLHATGREAWLKQVMKDLKGTDFNEKMVSDAEGIEIRPLFTQDDRPEFIEDGTSEFFEELDTDVSEALEEQGAGILTWNICEEIVADDIYLNDLVVASLRRGVNCMRIHTGDWDKFFTDIRKIDYQCTFTLNVESDLTEENIVNTWRERVGFIGNRDLLISGIEFDPISYFVTTNSIVHAEKSFNNLAQLFFRLTPHLHDCRLIKVDTTIYNEPPTGATEQLAYALAICSDYFDEMSKRNVPLEELIHLITFRFTTDPDYFLEIAKLRAFKIVWTNLLKAFIEDIEFIPNPNIHSVAGIKNDAGENKHNNLLQTTTEAMSAILGGCDNLSITSYDEADPGAMMLATHIQNLLRHESHFDKYRDAAQGSFYLEYLTSELAKNAWEKFKEIEEEGGFLKKWDKTSNNE